MGEQEYRDLVVLALELAPGKHKTVAQFCEALVKGWERFCLLLPLSDQEKLDIKNKLLYVGILGHNREG